MSLKFASWTAQLLRDEDKALSIGSHRGLLGAMIDAIMMSAVLGKAALLRAIDEHGTLQDAWEKLPDIFLLVLGLKREDAGAAAISLMGGHTTAAEQRRFLEERAEGDARGSVTEHNGPKGPTSSSSFPAFNHLIINLCLRGALFNWIKSNFVANHIAHGLMAQQAGHTKVLIGLQRSGELGMWHSPASLLASLWASVAEQYARRYAAQHLLEHHLAAASILAPILRQHFEQPTPTAFRERLARAVVGGAGAGV